MASSRQDYIAPWWTYWLHNFPHLNFNFQTVDSTFKPEDTSYQQSLIFLACVSAVGLGLSLLVLSAYLTCLCCRRREEAEEVKRPDTCCVTWAAVITGLVICSAVGVGFYGNSETNDGVYQLTYSIYNANHTLGSIGSLVGNSLASMQVGLKEHLERLDEIFSPRGDYTQTLHFMQQMANNIIQQLTAMPDTMKVQVDLAAIADKTSFIEYYRVLSFSHFSIMVCGVLTLIMSWASLGAGTATAVGTSDFCVSPDKFIVNQTKDSLSADIVHYYLYCSQSLPNPFQQSLTIFLRSLTTMQIQVQGLLQFTVAVYPTAEKDLLGIQRILNSSEFHLHQLTALLDCRSLHKDYLEALLGVCYDGVEGLLYLCLFSLLAACAFCALLCAVPHVWTLIAIRDRDYDDIDEEDPFNPSRRITPYNPSRAQVHSFCSYSSSMGSQTSLHPPLQATSSTPEYMNQSMLFERSPRYENVPLIGSGSPPPSYSPSMRTTYLSMTDAQIRHFGTDVQI
ncbi:protein tweety homolog 2-like [Sinocyclocheilus grahami]|uniref:protein tweety homolog 2-like n=1 Tax=Sinocyclocheilus grahami TaxID=75366 RepID=UPI0007AD14AC|nr:PREDICTED: protein tweety homolog 2-like [Sinocyclocheilus grahami]